MRSFSLPGMNRKHARAHSRWRWAVFLSAALAALAWRTQTAISIVPKRSRGAIDELAAGLRHRFDRNELKAAATAVLDRPESEEFTLPQGLTEAGEDNQGTFRPIRAEPDEHGVVLIDDAPAGMRGRQWVKGDGSPVCPDEHPIKGNASSRIYHLPGEPSYAKTIPELCFATEEDAQSAGFRARAK